jgi:ABC-type dipeptide/oligopeptide/nickel transport system permease subunit
MSHPQLLYPLFIGLRWALWLLFAFKLLLIILLPWLPLPSYTSQDISQRYQSPSFTFTHGSILGKDQLGRDLLARTLAGARTSLSIALSAMLTSLFLALVLGMWGGHYLPLFKNFILAIGTWLQTTPPILLASVLILILPRSVLALWLTLVGTNSFVMLRLVLQKITTLQVTPFFTLSLSLGASPHHLAHYHIIPQILPWLLIFGFGRLPLYIMQEATLSFLGLGINAPKLSWGTLINDGLYHLHSHPILLFAPLLSMIFCLMMLQWMLAHLLGKTTS